MRHFSAGRLPKGNHPIVGFFFDSAEHTLAVRCVRSPVAINSFIYCQVSLLCVCVPDPVIDEFASAPFLNLSSPQVLLGICQGYSIRIDWLLIDGAWRKLPFPYTGSHRHQSSAEENALAHVHWILMDWRSRTVVGHGSAQAAVLGDRHSCLVMCHAHYLSLSAYCIPPDAQITIDKFYQRNDNHPTAVACLSVIANPAHTTLSVLAALLSCRRRILLFENFSLILKAGKRNSTNETIERRLFWGFKTLKK